MISIRNILFISIVFSLASGKHTLKVIEGEDADIKNFPYMAAFTNYNGTSLECGACIINENTLLTAAHCVLKSYLPEVRIFYGHSIFFEGTITNVSKAYVHENFTLDYPYTDDIAILKVDPPLVFGETVQPIKLPQKNAPNPEGKLANYAGWGISNGKLLLQTTVLQKVNLTITDDKTCEEIYKGTIFPFDSQRELCAQADMSDGKNRGICYGDSGGPLVVDGVQYGITSSGLGFCGDKKFPYIYTRVSNYLDWLSDKL